MYPTCTIIFSFSVSTDETNPESEAFRGWVGRDPRGREEGMVQWREGGGGQGGRWWAKAGSSFMIISLISLN